MRRWLGVAAAMILLLGGCAMDVETYLQPPRAQGQQQAVQDALETALSQEGNGDGYVLKYPTGGTRSSAFLLLRADGTSTDSADEAVTAIAFYARITGGNTHIHLLRRTEDAWLSVADVVGLGTDIDKVTVGDLDGDGAAELLVGWSLYGRDYQLTVYQLYNNSLNATTDAGRYTDYFVGDMNADGSDEVILLHIGSNAQVTASMIAWTPQGTIVRGTARLDSAITGFQKLLFGKLSDGTDALYVDAVLDSGLYITELLYWDGTRLAAPLYDPVLDSTVISARAAHIPVMDVDGNGVPEFPATVRQQNTTGNHAAETWQWITEWYTWEVGQQRAVRQFAGIVNTRDGYFIELEDAWLNMLSVRYDTDTAILWLETVDASGTATPFLAVQDTGTADLLTAPAGYAFERLTRESPLRIWYDEDSDYHLTAEKISYMLVLM